jgi:hypothetical protein
MRAEGLAPKQSRREAGNRAGDGFLKEKKGRHREPKIVLKNLAQKRCYDKSQ